MISGQLVSLRNPTRTLEPVTQPFSSKLGLIHRLGLCSMVVPMTLPLAAQSTSTWNSTTNTNWSTATNWAPGIPASGDNIIISDSSSTANPSLSLDDGSHSVGTITYGTSGTRTSAFNLQTTAANTLTIAGGFTALGNFTGVGPRLRGNYILSANQEWQVSGEAGSHADDRGVAFNEVSAGVPGSVLLNANLNKSGTGQLTMAAGTFSGAGDINLNEGAIKINAGGSMPVVIGGTGKITANFSSALIFSRNSGTFNVTRPIQFNNTSRLATGRGAGGTPDLSDIASNMEWNGIHTITNNTNAAGNVPYRFTGIMSGSGTITKNGASPLTLGGTSANTLSGDVTVAAGELRLDKTGAIAVPGNILVTGGLLNVVQSNQIGSTSTITLTGGRIAASSGRTQTLAALNISTPEVAPSVSGFTVTGATAITSGTAELNSAQTFTTNSLSISNNSTLRLVGNNTVGTFSTINVGAGGLTLNGSRIQFGNVGSTGTQLVNLGGDLVSTGTSLFTVTNTTGPRIIDLQAGSRSFAVNDGSLDIRPVVQNGTLMKSGAGTLTLSAPGSTADFSFTAGPVRIATQANAGNVTLSGSSLLMDVGGATPAKLTASGNVNYTGGTIEITAVNEPIVPGVFELIRYSGTLTGNPTINIPAELVASRMAPVIDYGTGTDSAITLSSTAVPLSLSWQGAAGGGLWDNNATANFNGGSEKFFPLDSVTFDDTGASPSIILNSVVTPTNVLFDHGDTVATYTLTGTGSISGPTKLTKNGTGTTILATDNSYTGGTDILGGTLQVGNGGLTGSLGSGPVLVDFGTTLGFARDGLAVVPNVISGSGDIVSSGPGTVAFTANNNNFLGNISVTGGTFQFGDGGVDGGLGTSPIAVSAGATFAIKRTGGTPVISNSISGAGQLAVIGGSPNVTGFNTHTGGVSVSGDGVMRIPSDSSFGEAPFELDPDAIRLDHGGLKNLDSFTTTNFNRGVAITGEAYFTAGWSKYLTIDGPVSGTGNVFINHDNGTVLFNDATSTWNGILTLGADKPGFTGATGGILEIYSISNGGQPGPLGTASADPANLVFNGGRLSYTGVTAATDRGFTLQGNGSINVSFETLTMNGTATGLGALTKVGDGTLVLTGNNDFAGNVVVDDGVLSATHTNSLGTAAKTLVIAGDAGASRIPEVQLSGGISPVIADLDISGAGVGNLTGALHNVSGDNTLTVTNDVALRTGNGNTTLYSSAGTLTLNTPLVTTVNTDRQLILAGAGNGIINGVIANGSTTTGLPVVKNGTGTWTLNGAHTYTGTTTVNEGVLSLGQAALGDNSAVTIGENGVLHLNFEGIDQIGALTIGINPPLENGVYSAATHPGIITGAGSLRVGRDPAAGYTSWADGFPFTVGVNDGPEQDADGDGISNVLEYVLGGIPAGAGANNTSILPTIAANTNNLVFTFRRSDSSETDVTLKVQWSDTLGTWNDFATIGAGDALPAVDVTEDSPSAELDTVTVTLPRSTTTSGKLFVRLHATK
jgi:autotransporter-associated beta strand protein